MTLEDIALTMTPGIGVKGAIYLLGVFGDAGRIFAASESELTEQAELQENIVRHIVHRTAFGDAERELKYCVKHRIEPLASTDKAYPALLREIPDYPHVIYVQGDTEALSGRCVAMVGTRKYTSYGVRMCSELVSGLAERVSDLCIVSGLAFGLDAASHQAALAAGARTVAVLPNTLPEVVPAQHTALAREIVTQGGALVTEYNSQAKQQGRFYIGRNRIIAGLCAGTVVVESPAKGGSLETARFADEYDRTVMAVPGRAGDRTSLGTNLLIRNRKAQLVLSAEDIVRELMWDLGLPEKERRTNPYVSDMTDSETAVMACFSSTDPLSAEAISTQCGFEAGELSALLFGLEMTGALRQLPGNRYMKLI